MELYIDGTKKNQLFLWLIGPKGVAHECFKTRFEDVENVGDAIDEGNKCFFEFLKNRKIQFDGNKISVDSVFVNTGPGAKNGTIYSMELSTLLLFAYNVETFWIENKNIAKNLSNIFFESKNLKKMFLTEDQKYSEIFFYLVASLGLILLEERNYQPIIRIYDKLRPLVQNRSDLFNLVYNPLAVSYIETNDYPRALEILVEATSNEFSQKNADPWFNLGLVYRHQKNFKKAEEAFKMAFKIEPTYKQYVKKGKDLQPIC